MKLKKNKKIVVFIVFSLVLVLLCGIVLYREKNDIDNILKTKHYSYLPKEAQNYIKEVYEETGKVILTESNKKTNELYLNPRFVEYLTYTEEEKDDLGEVPISMIIDYTVREETKNVEVPSKYDMRERYVTPVRDQGGLGVCWTFATAGVAESYLLQNNPAFTIDNPLLISERQIDYVTSRNGIKDYNSEYVSFLNRSLGDGGNFYISTIAMANGVSLFNYNSFKEYDDTDLSRMELVDVINYNKSEYEVNSTINVPMMNLRESTSILTEKEIETRNSYLKEVKKNIMENGGAYVGTYMGAACQYTDSNLGNVVIDVYNCSRSGGHAMQIVGWDDDLEYSYCADTKLHKADTSSCNNVVKGKGVWILKNSWGDDTQYPYLTYDSLYSSIHFIDEMTSANDRTWDNNYVLGDGIENINEKTYYLKDTKIKGDEKIEKIKFITENPDTVYSVKVYKKDGSYKTFSKTTSLPGLITIDITEDIIVDKNTKIIISSEKSYIDKVSIFTSNIDTTPYIDLSKYDNIEISDKRIRLYSETKNIPSDTELTYKLYDLENNEISDGVIFNNNIVAENNINTLMEISNELEGGVYRVDVIYDSNVISSANIKIVKMQGSGTAEDPYIITNSTQLNQIRDDLDGYYELANDIDLTEDTREGGKLSFESEVCPQGYGWVGITNFNGTLDGKGHTIKGLYQNNYLECNVEGSKQKEWVINGNGLFGTAYGDVTIKNLVLEDFDINCSGSEKGNYDCGVLLTTYKANYYDSNEYNAIFENIVLKNSSLSNSSYTRLSYAGGLFGSLENYIGNVSISNIYLDFEMEKRGFYSDGVNYLSSYISGRNININDIQIKGYNSDYTSGSVPLIKRIYSENPIYVKNILSTVTGSESSSDYIMFGDDGDAIIENVNVLGIEDMSLCKGGCENVANVNIYNKGVELYKLTDKANYSTWENFDDNWVIETIDGIPRLPVLKFVDFEYTSIEDITIKQKLNEHKSIYDYIEPKIDSAKRISFKSNDEDIVKIDENGVIIPQKTGTTTIHVESYYDGYINDVPITIEYEPHYTIHFDSNGGTGEMDYIEVEVGKEYILPENKFTKEHYELKEWNTKADGTGTSYSDLGTIPAVNDGESITLYAIWWGEEIVVTFDANGGTVNPEKKVVRRFTDYGELPIPTRKGFGFRYWKMNSDTPVNNYDTGGRIASLLTAKWEENAYTIIYDANGGKLQDDYNDDYVTSIMSNSLATTYARNGQDKVIINNYLYEKSGYVFKGWNTQADGTGTSYSGGDVINLSNVECDTLRLYAQWEKNAYTLSFDANGGIGTMDSQVFNYNVLQKISKNIFIKEDYNFKGWNTKADGTGESYTDEQEISINNDLILYAQWERESYSVTFDANDGIFTDDKTTIVIDEWDDTKLNTLERPIREGYEFKGFFTEKEGGTSLENYIAESGIDKDGLVFYAQWEKVKHILSFDANGGIGNMDNQIFTYGDMQKISKNVFTKEGYSFKGWNTKVDGTGDSYIDEQEISITDNLTLYAIWEESYSYVINKYTVDEDNKYIDLIDIGTTVDEFKNNLDLSDGYTVDVEYKSDNGKNILYTGGKTRIYKDGELYVEYTNIIRGDVNGNAVIDIIDYIRIMKHIMEEIVLEGEFFKAADVTQENGVDIIDYIRIMKMIMEEN